MALQESYGVHKGAQARAIAKELKEVFHFPDTLSVEQDDYGNAILSVLPMRLVKAHELPILPNKSKEVRGAQWVRVDFEGVELHFLNTHLGLFSLERQRQAESLLGEQWLGGNLEGRPVLFAGDFNASPTSTVFRTLTSRLQCAQAGAEGHRSRNTFPGRYPVSRIDHIFCSQEFKILKVEIPRTHLTRLVSDHLPVIADLTLGMTPIAAIPTVY